MTECPICSGELVQNGPNLVCKNQAEHVFADYNGDWKLKISREVAIAWMKEVLYSDPDDDFDMPDFDSMTNEEIGEEICCSGLVHDEYFGEVVD